MMCGSFHPFIGGRVLVALRLRLVLVTVLIPTQLLEEAPHGGERGSNSSLEVGKVE